MESFIEEVLLDNTIILTNDEFEHLLSSLVQLYFSHWDKEGERGEGDEGEGGRYPKFSVKELFDVDPRPQVFFSFLLILFYYLFYFILFIFYLPPLSPLARRRDRNYVPPKHRRKTF